MASKEARAERIFPTPDTSLIAFSRYKIPSKYKALKIKLLQLGLGPTESDTYILLLEDGAKKIVKIAESFDCIMPKGYSIVCKY